MPEKRFIPPPRSVYDDGTGSDHFGASSYATYNYLGGGVVSKVKTQHFETALGFADKLGVRGDVVDFGCADGVLLPSLDARYDSVTAVDIRPDFIEVSNRVIADLSLSRTTTICTEGMDWDDTVAAVGPGSKAALFLLETLEHIGERDRFYESKIEFLDQLARMLQPDGVIIASVPNMVGLPLLAQRSVLAATRKYREPMSKRELFKGVVLRDASDLEARWTTIDHLGFNHRALEKALAPTYRVRHRRNIGVNVVYALQPVIGPR